MRMRVFASGQHRTRISSCTSMLLRYETLPAFLPRDATMAGIAMLSCRWLFMCLLTVCPSQVGVLPKRLKLNVGSHKQRCTIAHSFLMQNIGEIPTGTPPTAAPNTGWDG